jgi:hypothetical protein
MKGWGPLSEYALLAFGHTAVYDPVSNRMTIVGGIIPNGQGGIWLVQQRGCDHSRQWAVNLLVNLEGAALAAPVSS